MAQLKYWDGTQYVPLLGGIGQADADARYVQKTGDTMTGSLTVSRSQPNVFLQAAGANNQAYYRAHSDHNAGLWLRSEAAVTRWLVVKGVEPSGDLKVSRYDDAGNYSDDPFLIQRSTGEVFIRKQMIYEATCVLRSGWTNAPTVSRVGNVVTFDANAVRKSTAQLGLEEVCTIPVGYRAPNGLYPTVPTWNAQTGLGASALIIGDNGIVVGRDATSGIPPAGFYHYGAISYITKDAHP